MAIEARLYPRAIRDGGELTVRLTGAEKLANHAVTVQVARVDTIETGWVGSLGAEVSADGTLEARWGGLALGREAAVFVTGLQTTSAGGTPTTVAVQSEISIVNATALVVTADDAR